MSGRARRATALTAAKSTRLLIGAACNIGRRFARLAELGSRVPVKFVAVVERDASCRVKSGSSAYDSLLCQRTGGGWQTPVIVQIPRGLASAQIFWRSHVKLREW